MFLDKVMQKLDLSVVKNIILEDLAIDFTGADSWALIVSSDSMIARLTHIPGFTWPIQKVQIRVVVQDNGKDVGRLESPYQPASVSGGIVSSTISPTTMAVLEDSKPAFSDFVTSLATKDRHTFAIKGSADIIFNLGLLGIHNINGVDFLSDLTLKGLNNLPEIKCTSITEIIHEDANELVLKATLDILNPSQLSLTLGDLALSVITNTENVDEAVAVSEDKKQEKSYIPMQQAIGTITLENLTLMLGMNDSRTATIRLNTGLEETKRFLKRIEKEQQTVKLQGFQGTSKNEALTSGLASMTTTFVIPMINVPPVSEPAPSPSPA
ncbi:hypothetical protein BGZ49_006285 [Haplosporangium sp. Z 27]|nr:hypothetical protein BGZ49_006285 [Haplosporangium sp. Z 27]